MSDLTDVPLLTKALGGLLPRHAYHFHGEPGVGKTILGLQIARAWLQGGRTVLYLTAERGTALLEQATGLGFSLDQDWYAGRLILGEMVDAAPSQLDALGPAALLERVEDLRRTVPVTAWICDPLDALIPRRLDRSRQRRMVTDLIDGLQRRGLSSVLLSGDEMLRRNPVLSETLKDLCWATASLCRNRSGAGRLGGQRRANVSGTFMLEIDKSRQTTPAGPRVAYEIAQGAGLIPSPEAVEPGDPEEAGAAQLRPRVLLASGEPEIFLPLAGLLRRVVDTEVVGDGVEALSRAVTWNPDVIVAEIRLPRLAGCNMSRVLRQGRYRMPIILISRANRRHSERVRAYLNGATDFLFFPFDLGDMVYKIRVASQMRLHTFQQGVEEHMLEVLLNKARSHIMDVPIFLEAMGLSLQSGVRFSSPVSLVTFRLTPTPEGVYPDRTWRSFQHVLDGQARTGDLICFPDPHSAAVLLCHETRRGAAAFVRRLRRHLLTGRALPDAGLTGWSIDAATQTLHVPEQGDVHLPAILAAGFENLSRFFAPDQGPGVESLDIDSEQRRWGT